ncbi:MAG: hypothetical protein ACT4OP_01245 [Actinomycetota bacterium]
MGNDLKRALAEWAAVDPDSARMAESVTEWLTAGEGVEEIDLATVQLFAWYALPVKWSGPPAVHKRVLDAAAQLFDRLELPRYAALCRSAETKEIIDAYARSRAQGLKAFRQAYQRSGIDPPDLDDFAWGGVMGPEEATARATAERALEQAMALEQVKPGKSAWRSRSIEVTKAVLDSPHPTVPGQSYRTAILTARLDDWLHRAESRSPAFHGLRSGIVKRLLQPVPVPADAAHRMAPVTWFLERVEFGAQLTQAGYLPPAMVREGWERFSWDLGWTDRPPRSETEVVQVHELHLMLRRVGTIRRRGRDLRLTTSGRRMRNDYNEAWRKVAGGLSDGEWPRAVAEVFTLLLLDGEQHDRDLEARATAILTEMGWRTDGEPPDTTTVGTSWWVTRRPLGVLGGIERDGDWRSRVTRLTEFGEATLLEQIRVEATGPRSTPW